MDFDTAFDRLITNEGGYVNDPLDPGGETKYGISKRSYPTLDIRNLTRAEAKEIYRTDFWQRADMDAVDGAIAFQVFDAAVNHGIETAVRLMQRAAGVADDGHVGPVTITAVKTKSVTDMLMLFIAERLDYWTRLSNWGAAGKGWARRAAQDLRFAAIDA